MTESNDYNKKVNEYWENRYKEERRASPPEENITEDFNSKEKAEEWWKSLTELQKLELSYQNPHYPYSDKYKRFEIERDRYGRGQGNSLFKVELIESLQGIQNALEKISNHSPKD